jgi:SAM-dependent MidA family methyltransferase
MPADRLRAMIAKQGPVSVATYMALANAHYYATRDPLGAAGDFVTAPEISQMFGELAGLALADLWSRAGRPAGARYVELGPGRGTLAADALRAMRAAGLEPAVHLVETSPVLRAAQAERLPGAVWHDDLASLPAGGPVLAIANEFFDALPIRQWVETEAGRRELRVALDGERFIRVPAGQAGAISEASPASREVVERLARRLLRHGGAALIVDYGHDRTGTGDTLQAVRRHQYADPWSEPGESDLTAHVDFQALAEAAASGGARVHGPVGQGEWLKGLGIDARADALCRGAPARAEAVRAARDRLVSPGAMGRLFRVLALTHPAWPGPEGFR